MRITKIKIKNLFGIQEIQLDGSDVELTGSNGVGKTSVIDAIRYALTNNSNRDYIIRDGETEGEIIIETDTGLMIDRKKRSEQADYKSVKDGRNIVTSPESFLQSLFSELQINPVAFINMPKKEQNRAILDLIQFDWDLLWIKDQFGEIPEGVNYDQNILQVLNDIQADNGQYFQRRQDINRDIRNKRAFIEDIAKTIPEHYDADKWLHFDSAAKYQELARANEHNSRIQRARSFRDSYDNKVRGYQADMEIAISGHNKSIEAERTELTATIERLKAEIASAQDKLATLGSKLADKVKVEQANYDARIAKLEKDMGTADEYIRMEIIDTAPINLELQQAEAMKSHLNEYRRMVDMQTAVDELTTQSEELTRKIDLARSLPGIILETAAIPVEGLTVENGMALINGLPVSNLSEGEKLDLCVNVALSKPNGIQIILLDGVEKLSEKNRLKLYTKCKEKGVQFIATRTTSDEEMQVVTL